jgi:hypothetical protein
MIKAGEELLRLQAENQKLKEGIKQAREQMIDSKFYGKTVATYNDAIKDCVEIMNNLIEGVEE